ncbi:PREDICTED: RNA-directed DNA polymerase from mobile element jockey-like [Priapulus caudatus]|uniref:RNA-directed DNA polymerase from mobile element jockey-like n=1 Tax=Priapulus caudatus TaxID=37621 RepID=A0ABM1F4M6_PRICU|nr:PREDICTED: RNA-directed DNA polymerase from mobile element jockey-like [Priapulus caudatus]
MDFVDKIEPCPAWRPVRSVPQYIKADWDKVRAEAEKLQQAVLEPDLFHQRSVNGNWTKFKDGMLSIIQNFIPHKVIKGNNKLLWVNGAIKKAIKKKHRLFHKIHQNRSADNTLRYKTQKKLVRKLINQSHWVYLNQILNLSLKENNPRTFWRYIKSQKADNIRISPLRQNGKLYADSKTKAQLLNDQFKSVFTQENTSNIPDIQGEPKPSIGDILIDESGLKTLLSRINPNKDCGPDAIPNRIQKETAYEIAPLLSAIFQQSLDDGQLPSDRKKALVTPVYKKGDRHACENYRPVSLTCVCGKLLEHVIYRHILSHLETHNILTNVQHGFRREHSCETQLLTTAHDLIQQHDNKAQIDIAVLDFTKAFDTVPHQRLLKKLSHYGIRNHILK